MIHWNLIIYGIVALCSLMIAYNYITSYGGGMWSGGKKQFELDFVGWLHVAFLIIWTFIWGASSGGKLWD